MLSVVSSVHEAACVCVTCSPPRPRPVTWIPIIFRIPGFIAYYWVDAGNGVMVSTSLFETNAGAEESNRQVKLWRLNTPAASAALPTPPTVTAGQVVGSRSRKHP
jgi:hypothetical protein